jgi:hypothetical protein
MFYIRITWVLDVLYQINMGIRCFSWYFRDGTTDVTRTFHFGTPTDYEKVHSQILYSVISCVYFLILNMCFVHGGVYYLCVLYMRECIIYVFCTWGSVLSMCFVHGGVYYLCVLYMGECIIYVFCTWGSVLSVFCTWGSVLSMQYFIKKKFYMKFLLHLKREFFKSSVCCLLPYGYSHIVPTI